MFALVVHPDDVPRRDLLPVDRRSTAVPLAAGRRARQPARLHERRLRAALTPQFPHMSLAAIYGALIAYTCLLTWAGINGFRRRVLT